MSPASPIPLAIDQAFGVRDKVVIVTGASGWIGRTIAEVFATNGARLSLTDNREPALLALRDSLAPLSPPDAPPLAVAADLASRADLYALVDKTVARFGRLDAVVHCGGIAFSRHTAVEPEENFDLLFHTNLRSAWHLARASMGHLEKSQGSIVHIASVNGHRPMFPGTLYAATKAGLISMTREMAVEFGPRGIRVNSVSPGVIHHFGKNLDHMRKQLTPDAFAGYEAIVLEFSDDAGANAQPLKRGGRPVDVAMACVYLVSPAARFVTAADILVDGGFVFQFNTPGDKDSDAYWKRLRAYLRALPQHAWLGAPPEWLTRER